jgi:hypothetical protein
MDTFYLHWRFFISLEEDLVKLARYIELSELNFGVYSVEITRLFLSACAEIDAVLKLICKEIAFDKKPSNIKEYCDIIERYYYKFKIDSVSIPTMKLTFSPWRQWTVDYSPDWWKDHNKVKHERSKNFEQANLGNLLNAISALFVLLYYLYSVKLMKDDPRANAYVTQLQPSPQILILDGHFRYGAF